MTEKTPTFCELTFYHISDHSNQAIQSRQIVAESENNEHFIKLCSICMPAKQLVTNELVPMPLGGQFKLQLNI